MTNAQVGKVIIMVSVGVPANKEFGVTYDNMVAEVLICCKNATSHVLLLCCNISMEIQSLTNTVTSNNLISNQKNSLLTKRNTTSLVRN